MKANCTFYKFVDGYLRSPKLFMSLKSDDKKFEFFLHNEKSKYVALLINAL